MSGILEIRWHGRGGQGAVTAAKLLAGSALREGKHIQAFPEYGPERTGAPVKSFTRISDSPIRTHSQVTAPKVSIVLDPTLLEVVDVAEGLPEDGVLIINTTEKPANIRKQLGLNKGKIFTVDATAISIENIGRNIPNTPMMGALIKATGVIKLDTLLDDFKEKFSSKFRKEVLEGNVNAIKKAYEEVIAE